MIHGPTVVALAALLTVAAPAAGQRAELVVEPDSAAGFRPRVTLGPILADSSLQAAAREGLPVRVRLRVELWKDRFLDDLLGEQGWERTVWFDPLREQWALRSGGAVALYPTWARLRQAVEGLTVLTMRPVEGGTYYYTANVDVETLSLSDLEELERWLQGELGPAVTGDRSLPGALGQGAKRLLIRLLGLPAREVEARSGRFLFPPPGAV